jgi:predicted TIM-barrel fold metal-dependent hydrolase
MDKMKGMGRNGPWPGGPIKGKPSEIFKKHVFINPYHEEDHVKLAELIGASQVVFGSDYPHAEGMENPIEFLDELRGQVGPAELQMIVHDNARNLVSVS